MSLLKNKRIGVLMGGWAPEREISLKSGKNVSDSLRRQGFEVVEIDIDHNLPLVLQEKKIDIAFLALHGVPGEDGSVQGLLEIMEIPYTGSGILGSAVSMNKITTKEILLARNIPTPRYFYGDFDIKKIIETVGNPPLIVKAVDSGSSLGVELVKELSKLESTFNKIKNEYGSVFIEEYIKGMQITVPILEDKVLPVIELVPKNEFFDYEAKYTHGLTDFVIPARLPEELYKKAQDIALRSHFATGCKCFSRADMIIPAVGGSAPGGKDSTPFSGARGATARGATPSEPVVLEINSIPGLTEISTLPASAERAGISYDEVVYKILSSAVK